MSTGPFFATAFAVGLVASVFFAVAVRRMARRGGPVDVPDERSLHADPTPRGAGIGLALAVAGILGLSGAGSAAWLPAVAIMIVAIVGWLDDMRSLSVGSRLAVHFVAGALLATNAHLSNIGFMGAGGRTWLDFVSWLLWTVVLINLVNFMDGADTLIGMQALVFSGFALVLLRDQSSGAVAACLLGASLGFLAFNLPPARVFLGDAGSGTLGVIFAYIGMVAMQRRGFSAARAYAPLIPMFADESLTVVRRLSLGESLLERHRKHLYQQMVLAGWGHGSVGLLYALASFVAAAWALSAPGAVAYHVGVVVLIGIALIIVAAARARFDGKV